MEVGEGGGGRYFLKKLDFRNWLGVGEIQARLWKIFIDSLFLGYKK
jgi:hypothetical protein